MRALTIIVPFCILGSALADSALAQEPQRTTEAPVQPLDAMALRNSASVFFERNLNTFTWIGRAMLDTTLGSTRVHLTEQFTSNIIQIDAGGSSPRKRLRSDQQNIMLRLDQKLAPTVSAVAEWSSLSYSDDKAVGLSTASSHSVLGGFEYAPAPYLVLTPLAGYRWENQLTRDDRGFSYTLSAAIPDFSGEGYRLGGVAQFHQDRLDPRLLERHTAVLGMQKSLSSQTNDSLVISFSRNRREFYTFGVLAPSASGQSIESRIDNILTLSNLLNYEIDRNFAASAFVTVMNRNLDRDFRYPRTPADTAVQFDTEIHEFRLETSLQATYHSDDSLRSAIARLTYSERDETHRAKPLGNQTQGGEILFNARNRQEQTKDNVARRTAVTAGFRFPLSGSDQIALSGSASLLRYDTPSELNLEDRDEFLAAVTLQTSHRIGGALHLTLALDGSLSHLVYLLKERSANNNINRVLRFSPRVAYRPFPFLTSINSLEVLANYTVYDFEKQVALVRSFSYRQFGWMDSTSVEVTSRLGLDFFGYLKLYERGQLMWTEFTERPENSFVDKTYFLQARFSPLLDVQLAVGVRYFSQSRYIYDASGKKLDAFFRSIGPTCLINWQVNTYGRLDVRGWYEQRQLADGSTKSLPNMILQILINF